MSYFYTQEHVELPVRTGKAVGNVSARERRISPKRVAPTRDEVLDREVQHMNAKVTEDVVLAKVDRTMARPIGIRQTGNGARGEGIIYSDPRPDPAPKPRIRPGVSDDELRKIWAEDERKARAAQAMETKDNPVEKMYKCEYPQKHTQDLPPPPRRRLVQERNEGTHEPPGLAGVGRFCEQERHHGRRTVEPNMPFEAPSLIVKQRHEGKKMESRPRDTWSLNNHVTQPGEDRRVSRRKSIDPSQMQAAGADPNGKQSKEANRFYGFDPNRQ